MLLSMDKWCSLENDSVIFTQLLKKLDTKGINVVELWSIDDRTFDSLKPIYGLIFFLNCIPDDEPSVAPVVDDRLSEVYFSNQVISNACVTQAFTSVLMNCNHADVDIGAELRWLKELTQDFNPLMRGLALSNTQTIRSIHNSFAHSYERDSRKWYDDSKPNHFVCIMPINGKLYELDGKCEGPMDHGKIPSDQDWITVAQPILMKKIRSYKEGEIPFTLMCLLSDKSSPYQLLTQDVETETSLYNVQPNDGQDMQTNRMSEESKLVKYQQEVIRRRHDYLPFLVAYLKVLADKKKLTPLMENSKNRVRKRRLRLKM